MGTGRRESKPGSGSVQSGCVLVRKAFPIQGLDFPIFKGEVHRQVVFELGRSGV